MSIRSLSSDRTLSVGDVFCWDSSREFRLVHPCSSTFIVIHVTIDSYLVVADDGTWWINDGNFVPISSYWRRLEA